MRKWHDMSLLHWGHWANILLLINLTGLQYQFQFVNIISENINLCIRYNIMFFFTLFKRYYICENDSKQNKCVYFTKMIFWLHSNIHSLLSFVQFCLLTQKWQTSPLNDLWFLWPEGFFNALQFKVKFDRKKSLWLFKPRHGQFSILCHPSSDYVAWNSVALYFSEDVPFNVTGMLKKTRKHAVCVTPSGACSGCSFTADHLANTNRHLGDNTNKHLN